MKTAKKIALFEGEEFVDPYGEEQIVNGTFDADTNWTKGDGWTISSGEAHSSGDQATYADLKQTGTLGAGVSCLASFDITSYTAGTVRFVNQGAGNSYGSFESGTGTYTHEFTSVGAIFRLQSDPDFNGSIDNFSVKEVL